ncbi:hypothetical protein IH601_09435, partial [Candidatus Bipolaricaulota bacterium]|nr:hypothetical protein [Candidatus Bipolaricaulota bacterium]
FHMLSHSLAKTVSFASAGMLGQSYGTHDLRHFQGIVRRVPVWGTSLVIGLLVLIGIAPFSIFLSEFFILKAALSQRAYWTACLLLVGLCVVFISVLRSAIAMAWESDTGVQASHRFKLSHGLLVFIPLAVLLVLGVWMPESFVQILIRASELLGGTP